MSLLSEMTLRELLHTHHRACVAEANASYCDDYWSRVREERDAQESKSAVLAEIERRIAAGGTQ